MRPALRNLLEHSLCIVGLFLVAGCVLLPAVLWDKVPFDTNSLYRLAPWEEARPADVDVPPHPAEDLTAQRYYPWLAFMNASAREGQSLLWSPLEGFGLPFLALWRSRCLSPFSIPYYCLPLNEAFTLSLFLKFIVAGLAAFYAARRLGFTTPTSAFVAVSFMFSGTMMVYRMAPLSDVLPWLPLLLLFGERLALGQYRMWPVGAIVLALMLLGGEPECAAGALAFVGIYFVVRSLSGHRTWASLPAGLAALALGVAMGAGIAAAQLLPFIEFLGQADLLNNAHAHWPRCGDLLAFFFPGFFGEPSTNAMLAAGGGRVETAAALHAGLYPFLLVPLWLSLRRFAPGALRLRVEAFLVASACLTALAIVAGYLSPRLAIAWPIRPEHLVAANALAFAFVGAAAAEEWVVLDPEQCAATLRRLAICLVVLLAIAVGLVISERATYRPYALDFVWQVAIAASFTLAFAAVMTVTLLRPSARAIGYALCALSLIQLMVVFRPCLSFTPSERLFPRTSFVEALQDGGGRVSGVNALAQWPLAGNGVAQIAAPAAAAPPGALLKRQAAFLARLQQEPLLVRRTGSDLLVLTREDVQGPFAGVRSDLNMKAVMPSGAVLFDDPERKPRAWMAYSARAVDTFDPAALDAEAPPIVEDVAPPQDADEPVAAVRIEPGETHTEVRLHIDETRAGILVLADAWYPGWMASVDGAEAPVFRVDGVFRGVQVGAGTHDVRFYYKSNAWRLGVWVSASCAAFTALGFLPVFFHVRGKRRKPRGWL